MFVHLTLNTVHNVEHNSIYGLHAAYSPYKDVPYGHMHLQAAGIAFIEVQQFPPAGIGVTYNTV